jgi:hypothetical protein
MQQNPLIERLDWVFISQAWSLEYPRTMARTLTRDTSDHVPCAIFIKTEVSKPRIFFVLRISGWSIRTSMTFSINLGAFFNSDLTLL